MKTVFRLFLIILFLWLLFSMVSCQPEEDIIAPSNVPTVQTFSTEQAVTNKGYISRFQPSKDSLSATLISRTWEPVKDKTGKIINGYNTFTLEFRDTTKWGVAYWEWKVPKNRTVELLSSTTNNTNIQRINIGGNLTLIRIYKTGFNDVNDPWAKRTAVLKVGGYLTPYGKTMNWIVSINNAWYTGITERYYFELTT